MSFRFYDPETDAVVDLLGRQPPARAARPAGDRLVLGRHRHLRGRGHVRGPADPRAVHVVGRDVADTALGAGVLRRRRRDVGDELGHGLHPHARGGGVSALEQSRRASRRSTGTSRRSHAGAEPRARGNDPQVVRHRARRRPGAARDPRARTPQPARRGPRPARSATSATLGFVVLHRCGEDFYFLLVCTWRNENELWETVWAKNGDADVFFRPWPADGAHRPTFCVWELGAVCHERDAWTSYLRSRPRRGGTEDVFALLVPGSRVMASVQEGRSSSSSGSSAAARGTGRRTCASRSNGPRTRSS